MYKYICIFSFFIILCGCDKFDLGKIKGLKIVAHRGGTTLFAENSLAAIANAVSLGVDAIEIDIRLCKDSTIIVCHDDNIDRVTNGSGKIKDMTYKDILAFPLVFKGKLTDQVIPSLEDVLRLVDKKVELYIEIKEGSPFLEQQLLELLERYDCYDAVSIISFDYQSLLRIAEQNKDVRLKYVLFNEDDASKLPSLSYDMIDGMILDYQNLNKEVVDNIKAINKTIEVFTLDNVDAMPENNYNWIEGLITNSPEYWMCIRQK